MTCVLGGDDFLLRRHPAGWLCLLTLSATILFCGQDLSAQTQPKESAPHVGTVNAERKPIEKTHDFVGRVEAINRVEVRAREGTPTTTDKLPEAVGPVDGSFVGVAARAWRRTRAHSIAGIGNNVRRISCGSGACTSGT
jgi:hypothetical protein